MTKFLAGALVGALLAVALVALVVVIEERSAA